MDEFEQIIVIRSNKIDLLNTDNTLQTKFNNTILLQPICFYFVHDRGKICFFLSVETTNDAKQRKKRGSKKAKQQSL